MKPTAQELRVAKAIRERCQDYRADGSPRDMKVEARWSWRETTPKQRRSFIQVARTAIKAMRKP